MTVPTLSTVANDETTVSVTFSAAIVSASGQPGLGFTVTKNGAAWAVTGASAASATVTLTVATISQGDLVEVAYNGTTGDLADFATGVDQVATFTATESTNSSEHAALLGVVVGLIAGENNIVTLVWSMPVTSVLGLATGLTFEVNGVSRSFTSAVAGGDPRQIRVTFPSTFTFDEGITFSYDSVAGDWTSGVDIVAITDRTVTNASTVGTPTSDYPLSSVIREALTPVNGTVTAIVSLDLNWIDQRCCDRYGPATVDVGGTFGVTVGNPDGLFVAQSLKTLKSGLQIKQSFAATNHSDWAADAAAEWLTTITERIADSLNKVRQVDQSVVLGTQTIAQV